LSAKRVKGTVVSRTEEGKNEFPPKDSLDALLNGKVISVAILHFVLKGPVPLDDRLAVLPGTCSPAPQANSLRTRLLLSSLVVIEESIIRIVAALRGGKKEK
jgi:hypothetical protein